MIDALKLSKDGADQFLRSVYVGLAATLLMTFHHLSALPIAVVGIASGLIIVALLFSFFRRNRDEYTRALWNAGASAAFGAVLLYYFGGSFVEGFYDGLRGVEPRSDFHGRHFELVALLAFYLTIVWRHFRGTAL